jgi:hypothetical protein
MAQKHQQLVDSDLSMAAHYYQIAVEKHHSARANFNLGFLHESGLGLKQNFPLAKQHYDLAGTSHVQEAELAVQIALWSMSLHEQLVKLHVIWNDYWSSSSTATAITTNSNNNLRNQSKTTTTTGVLPRLLDESIQKACQCLGIRHSKRPKPTLFWNICSAGRPCCLSF